MAKKTNGSNLESRDPANEIIKHLRHVQSYSGNSMSRIFDDWLLLVEATLEAMPRHAESAAKTGKMAEDTPEHQALWERMRGVYPKPACWEEFSMAMAVLLDQPDRFWRQEPAPGVYGYDLLGRVYSEFSYKPGSGQYFTPWTGFPATPALPSLSTFPARMAGKKC